MDEEQVEWIVNDLGELGVKIGEQCFFLYKGRSYVGWREYRKVWKREFGECCHLLVLKPGQLDNFKDSYPGEADLDAWRPIPNRGDDCKFCGESVEAGIQYCSDCARRYCPDGHGEWKCLGDFNKSERT